MKKIRILSLDGGGIRGILPGTILTYIEEQLQLKTKNPNAKIGSYFDLIAGTSTGGILALVYACPDATGAYKFSAKEALDIYLDQGDEIFDISLGKKIRSAAGVLDEKYDAEELESTLLNYLGETTLSEALTPCLITSYNIRKRKAHFFNSIEASSAVFNFKMKDVARATAAAPTYFEPANIHSVHGNVYPLIDGGVFANNPSLCAYAEARTIDFAAVLNNNEKPTYPTAKDMLLVSIGTGTANEPYSYKEFKDASALKWIKPLIDILMSGNSETVDYQLQQIYETLEQEDCNNYYRIQPTIVNADSEMDNATLKNLRNLHIDGLNAVATYKETLDSIVDKLIAHH